MLHWFEVKAVRNGVVEHADFALWGPDAPRDFDTYLAAVTESVREQNPGCKIEVRKGQSNV